MISPFGWGFKLIMKLGLIVNTCCISVCSFYLFRVTLMSVSMIKHDVYLCNVLVYIVLYTLIQKKCRVLLHCAPRERYALDHEHSLRNHSFGKPVGRFLSISFFFFSDLWAFCLHQLLLVVHVALSTGPGLEAGSIHSVLVVTFVDRERQFSFVSLHLLAVVLSLFVWQICSLHFFLFVFLALEVCKNLRTHVDLCCGNLGDPPFALG